MATTRGQHLIGQEIGSYILEQLLGYGGSSAVFLAHSLSSQEQVAIKVFLPRSTLDNQMRKSFYRRFLREAEAASQLAHANILSIYAYGEHEGMPYIVMPYMPGGTLSEHVQKHGPLSLQEALIYLEQIADALDFAHTNGCVHCDVKPANILLDGAGGAALSDFGIVRMQSEEEDASSKSGEVLMGTPDYISPEQALGKALDGRSDVYSLGATLYFLLTGEPPFKSESLISLALMHVHEAPTPLGLLRADVTPQMDFVLSKALAKWPQERFQTTGAFYAAFALAVQEASETSQTSPKFARPAHNSETPALATPVVRIKRLVQPRLNPWRLGLTLGLLAVLLLSCLLTTLLVNSLNSPHSSPQQSHITPTTTSTLVDAFANQNDWPTSSTFFFQGDSYFIQNKLYLNLATTAIYPKYQFSNFRLSVNTVEVSGSFNSADYYGVVFHTSADQSHYYLFEVSAWNQGQYGFERYDGESHWSSLAVGKLPNFHTQSNQMNNLSISSLNHSFTFTVNGQQVGPPIQDTLLTSGEIGLVVEEQNTEVAFSKLYITRL
jgi:serine/threonine protein kinase